MKVKRILLVLAVGCGCLAFALQQQPRKYVILDDKKGGFKIFDVESFVNSFDPSGDYGFEATGSPMRGFSKEQGLTFSTRAMEGVAERTEAGSFRIRSAKATGDVVAEVASTDADGTSSKSHIETGVLTISEGPSDSTLTFPGPFGFANRVVSGTVDRFLEVIAPSGVFVLPPLSQASGSGNPFKSAKVRGPVNVTVDSKRKESGGTSRQLVKIRADSMTYNGATRTLRLEGNVVVDYEATPVVGKSREAVSNAEWVTVELNEDSTVKMVKMGGGTATLKEGGGK